jgi:CHASE3 domain sensor protein
MKINLKAKKTETEWQKTLDNFWMKAAPQWFEWLGWILILGAITFH